VFDQAAPVRIFSASLIIIFNPNDVVLTEITSGLNLNQFQDNLAGVFQPMSGTDRDVDRLIFVHDLDEFVDGYARRAAHHDPVLGAVMMLLQREPASRLHDDALDLVTISGVDRLIASPRAMHLEMILGDLWRHGLQFATSRFNPLASF